MLKLLRAAGIATIFVFVGLLAACEHKVPATNQPTVAPPVASLPDTAHLVTLSPQDSIITIRPAAARQALAPDSALRMEDSKTVAPGLSVTISGIFVTESDKVKPQRILLIKRRGHITYTDTTADFLYEAPFESKLYPLWVPTGQDTGELLIDVESPPDLGLARRFFIKSGHVIKTDTLPVFDEKARNLDKDPSLEIGGRRYSGEGWTDEQGREWQTYTPKLYYEVRPTGLVLDTALTKRKAIAQYGAFRGFEASSEINIRIKRPK